MHLASLADLFLYLRSRADPSGLMISKRTPNESERSRDSSRVLKPFIENSLRRLLGLFRRNNE
jgi:hypothetical protein